MLDEYQYTTVVHEQKYAAKCLSCSALHCVATVLQALCHEIGICSVECTMTQSEANAALSITTSGGVQSCDGVMWRRIMQQFTSLGLAPDNLPEEALTQIYQASKWVSQPLHVAATFLGHHQPSCTVVQLSHP